MIYLYTLEACLEYSEDSREDSCASPSLGKFYLDGEHDDTSNPRILYQNLDLVQPPCELELTPGSSLIGQA